MAKLPYMQFFPADWLLDTLMLSPTARGIWIDILSFMWRSEPRTGVTECTAAVWCKRLRCTDAQFRLVVKEFELENICDVMKDECKDIVRLTSRRIVRDELLRKNGKLYVRKHRSKKACKTDVRPMKDACKGENQNQNHISESELKRREEGTQGEARSVQKRSRAAVCDVEWLQSLKENAAYTGINIDLEYKKALAWYPAHNRQLTRRAFVNWLIREMGNTPVSVAASTLCTERIQAGNFLKNCGDPSVILIGGQPRCQTHKEAYESRISRTTS
jgi:uncharacterized protein YdaU (DUF1376 family)